MIAPSSVASTAPETASKTKISPWMAGRPLVRFSGQTEIDLTAAISGPAIGITNKTPSSFKGTAWRGGF